MSVDAPNRKTNVKKHTYLWSATTNPRQVANISKKRREKILSKRSCLQNYELVQERANVQNRVGTKFHKYKIPRTKFHTQNSTHAKFHNAKFHSAKFHKRKIPHTIHHLVKDYLQSTIYTPTYDTLNLIVIGIIIYCYVIRD